jgi:hypothetical protein
MRNARHFCTLLCDQLTNLKKVSFTIYDSYELKYRWKPSCIDDGENISTKRILNLIHCLVDNLKQLVSLHMNFNYSRYSEIACYPYLIRRQLHEWPLSRRYRMQCSSQMIQIWL